MEKQKSAKQQRLQNETKQKLNNQEKEEMEKRKSAKRQRLQNETKQKLAKSIKININSLPDELLIMIFDYLTHNELGQIARVCKKWRDLTRSAVLWKVVDVVVNWDDDSAEGVERTVMNSLSPCTSHIQLNFQNLSVDFRYFSRGMRDVCPNLEVLIIYEAYLDYSFLSCLSISAKFLKKLRILCFDRCKFELPGYEIRMNRVSKIEVLSIRGSDLSLMYYKEKSRFPRVPFLKEFHFIQPESEAISWWLKDETFIISNLKILNLSHVRIYSNDFRIIQNKAPNLVELYVCYTFIRDDAFIFGNSTNVFPHLEVICVFQKEGPRLTMEGVISCIKSCRSLRRIHLSDDVWNGHLYSALPSFEKNRKLEVVQVGCDSNCGHYFERKDYLHD